MDEDKKVLSDAEHIFAMVESTGWQIIKAKLDEYILDIQNIKNVLATVDEKGSEAAIINELRVRDAVADTLHNWMKVNVYGALEQVRASQNAMYEGNEQFIDRN